MEYRKLGKWGLKVSEVSLGGWTTFGSSITEGDLAKDIITKAYESGINFFDISDAYGRGEAEKMMGAVLKDFPRHTLVIASKLYWPQSDDPNDRGLSRKHITESIDKSLQRIGTEYLDLYFCHRYDEETPLIETIRAMDDLIHRGKILYWGTSEWSAAQLQAAHDIAEQYNLYPPVVEQPQYNLVARQRFEQEIAPKAQELGMGLVTWSPLASGLLTGKYDDGLPEGARLSRIDWLRNSILNDTRIEAVKAFKAVADKLNVTRAQVSIAWAMHHSDVSSVITGATKVTQLEQNLGAAAVELTAEVMGEIDELFPPGHLQDEADE